MKIRFESLFLFGLVCAWISVSSAFVTGQESGNWPEFRGPNANGCAPNSELPVQLTEESARWKMKVHGKGWSSPVVWENRIWLTTATENGKSMSVLCFDLETGEKLHDKVVFENEKPNSCHSLNSYASPTPVVAEGKVFVHFGKYGTACLDSETCEKQWVRQNFECNHFRGPASSPILFDGKLFVAFDGADKQYVVALEAETGETVWKTDRQIDYGTDNGDRKKAYGTAAIFPHQNTSVLVYPSAVGTEAYDLQTGEIVWRVVHGGMNVSARPVVSESGIAVITNGMGKMIGMRLDGNDDVTESHVEWISKSSVSKKSSPMIVDELLYMVSDDGVLSCVDVDNGETLYRERAKDSYAASPIYASGKIYFFGMDGEIVILRPGRTYESLATLRLGSGFMASPAVSGNKLILRSKTHLYCFEDQVDE